MVKDHVILCTTAGGWKAVDVKLIKDTVWPIQYQIAYLSATDHTYILKHIKNIRRSGGLDEHAACAKFAQVQKKPS